MPKESEKARITAKTGTLLVRVIDDADGTPVSRNMTSVNLASEIAAAAGDVTSVNGSTGAVTLAAGDIAFTPAGTVAATTVQAAIEEVASEAGTEGVPLPSVEGTDGQVLVIAATDPSLSTAWADASTAVDAAIDAHDAETAVHGIADTSALLDSADIGTNVQAYAATTSHMVQYAAGWPARPAPGGTSAPAGTVIWVNKTDATAPTADEAGDLIFLTGA